MSKMASHEPFEHLQPKLWPKEGSGVKLAVWFPTIKSRESTRFRCVKVECDIPLESSRGELQPWFKPHPNPSSRRRVMSVQSPRNPNRDNFETSLWEPREKESFGCRCDGELQEYFMREVVASPESRPWWVKWIQVSPWLVPTPKRCRMSSNQLVGWIWM